MSRRVHPAVLLVSVLIAGCSGPRGTEMTAAEYVAWEASQRSTELPEEPPASEGPSAEQLADRADELAAARLELDHDATRLASDRAQAQLQHGLEQAEQRQALTRAGAELEMRRAELTFFTEVDQARALDALALDEARAEDALLETREELAQLELMYGQDLGEATAEIVLARTRRRLTRSEERLRLTRLEGRRVREVELPARHVELAQAVADAELAQRSAQDRLALGDLEREAAQAELDHRGRQLARRQASQQRKEQALEEDRRAAERRGGEG